MKNCLFLAGVCLVSSMASAQVLFSDDMESLTPGALSNQNGWLTTSSTAVPQVVTSGGGNPAAHSGTQMIAEDPTTTQASYALQVLGTAWGGRDSGNDILALDSYIYVSSNDTAQKTSIMQVTGIGGAYTRMGFVGVYTRSDQFIFGNNTDIFFGGSINNDAWNHLHLEIDTVNNTYAAYGNGAFIGGSSYDSAIQLTSAVLSSFNIDATTGASYFDDFSAQAVPEPVSLVVLGLGAVAALRRRKKA